MAGKKTIAVVFGGRSVEHDVSILTGLQFLEALDPVKYDGIPVYIDPLGQWWTGSALTKRSHYPLQENTPKGLQQVSLDLASKASGKPQFISYQKGLMGEKRITIPFDLIVPAIHGSNGEDGTLQGLLDFADIPYAGCRPLGAAATMDKFFAKKAARSIGLKVLPELIVNRPVKGSFLEPETLKPLLVKALGKEVYPLIVKPCNLGSSVGVNKANDMDGLIAALMTAFRLDSEAIIEPFVPNLTEYNIACMNGENGTILTSAIERPAREAELLDFKNKYLAGGSSEGPKLDSGPSAGMVSLNRTLNPEELTTDQDSFIRKTASDLFSEVKLAASVRVDFLCDSETGDIWLNEANTIPGSFAYFLWEAAAEPISFLSLTSRMIEEGFALSSKRLGATDTKTGNASIFG